MTLPASLPPVRGKLIPGAELAPYTWFRVGGPADALFLPADEEDLAAFLKALDPAIPVTVLGVGSNLIVRDFLSGIPGSLGGATRTNAGCYGAELRDRLVALHGFRRDGTRAAYRGPGKPGALPEAHFSYRHTDLPDDLIVTRLILEGTGTDDPATISAAIAALQARRAETQPIKEKTSGSTFANPDPPGTPDQRSAWKLIDAAGCRGLKVGGAQVSPLHCNFLINTGTATAADLEALGELVRARVLETSGIDLRWEVRRMGRVQRV
ncbi:MAG: UDP-N-acetylenolpyruvoylglucosamine reductase [Hyphomonas sp. 32-62-5]|nr:MAG: UDP-N-acetylenolpyruvoylglucosamine reductase [Hyphomonas sp. 32-62-5]